MPYVMNWEPGGVVKTFDGVVSSQELVQSFREVGAHPLFDHLTFILSDFSAVTRISLEAWAVQEMAVMRLGSRQTNRRIRSAMVGGAEIRELQEAMSRPPLEGTRPTAFFATVDLARQWLASSCHAPCGISVSFPGALSTPNTGPRVGSMRDAMPRDGL
jgi:hypothetical protein